jgi:hypothetical protein
MAKNLYGIVADAEKRGTLKKKIAETARMVDASGKSGRFHDYMVDPALSEEDQKKRIKRLVKNVSGYLQIAEHTHCARLVRGHHSSGSRHR